MPRRFRNTRRENRLEELGRVDAEKAYTRKGKRNLREEKDRIRSELKEGGPAGRRAGPGQPDPSRPKSRGPRGRKKFGPEKLEGQDKKKGINIFVKLKGGEGPANRHDKIRKVNFSKGGKAGKPRVKKRGGGLSQVQQHYLQHGYGPHKSSGKVLKGKKIGIQIK